MRPLEGPSALEREERLAVGRTRIGRAWNESSLRRFVEIMSPIVGAIAGDRRQYHAGCAGRNHHEAADRMPPELELHLAEAVNLEIANIDI